MLKPPSTKQMGALCHMWSDTNVIGMTTARKVRILDYLERGFDQYGRWQPVQNVAECLKWCLRITMNISMLFASMMNDCINGTIEVVVRCHQLNNNIFLRLTMIIW